MNTAELKHQGLFTKIPRMSCIMSKLKEMSRQKEKLRQLNQIKPKKWPSLQFFGQGEMIKSILLYNKRLHLRKYKKNKRKEKRLKFRNKIQERWTRDFTRKAWNIWKLTCLLHFNLFLGLFIQGMLKISLLMSMTFMTTK